MTSRDRGGTRRTPMIGAGEGAPGPEPSTEHAAHAYTRKQLQGLDSSAVTPPVASASQPPLVEQVSPERARLPEPQEMGAIIGFQRSYDGKTVYSYAAIKTPKGWYCTNLISAMTWPNLLAWIDGHQSEPPAIWLAADWVEVQ